MITENGKFEYYTAKDFIGKGSCEEYPLGIFIESVKDEDPKTNEVTKNGNTNNSKTEEAN